ncbi:MAG TPA: GNAT family N-acetyltransferase [Jatrophihabitantaceae bacterium]|jgi:ribosomal protein S18 acetylase RimI-like enzyme|nr:GNAT family N-acetyltransferase [Jatrophihabitantaceae bacterium]
MPLVLNEQWLGRRVVVRRLVDRDQDDRLVLADAVGDLLEVGDDDAVIETRSGTVTVRRRDVTAARLAVPSAAEVLSLEAVSARGWRSSETAEIDGWLLRADGGCTGRANAALPLRTTRDLNAVLGAARDWYATRGLPLRIQSPLPTRRLLDTELAARGWLADPDVQVLAARLDMLRRVRPADGAPPHGHDRSTDPSTGLRTDVRLEPTPDAAWLAAAHRDAEPLPLRARALLTRHDAVAFASIRTGGRAVAIARGAVDAGWLGITAVEVDPAYRRLGLADSLLAALWAWGAREHAASRSYLQVRSTDTAAISAYTRLGYWRHHDYRSRTEPATGQPSPAG